MRKRKSNDKKKQPESSHVAGGSKKRRAAKEIQSQSQVPVSLLATGLSATPYDEVAAPGTEPKSRPADPRIAKSQAAILSIRKNKAKKKQDNKRQDVNENEEPAVEENIPVVRSDYKLTPSDKASLRPKSRKKKSNDQLKSKKREKDESKRDKKIVIISDAPSRRIKKKPGSDELCMSSELPKQDEVDVDQSQPEKSCLADGRIAWVQSIYQKRVKGVVKEFGKARDYLPISSFAAYSAHESKNRYADVLCADETRVVLKGRRPNNNYIHASWVSAPVSGSQRYICAQGPMEETVLDFWHMIFYEKIPIIVMLCSVMEGGYEKCSQYWPAGVGESIKHGKFKIKNEKIESTNIGAVKCTTLNIQNLKVLANEDVSMTVLHYQWGDWPDHVSPSDPGIATELLKTVKEKAKRSPIVVHCSAGIGRTGTFCGVDYANDRLRTNTKITMPEIVHEMRRQRVHSVQSNPQYVYIHLCLLHLLIETKVVPETDETRLFFADYRKYMEAVSKKVGKKSHHRGRGEKEIAGGGAEKEKEGGGGGSAE